MFSAGGGKIDPPGLAVPAPLQRLPLRAGEAEPFWTDQPVSAAGKERVAGDLDSGPVPALSRTQLCGLGLVIPLSGPQFLRRSDENTHKGRQLHEVIAARFQILESYEEARNCY